MNESTLNSGWKHVPVSETIRNDKFELLNEIENLHKQLLQLSKQCRFKPCDMIHKF